jgi:hypothetical protein
MLTPIIQHPNDLRLVVTQDKPLPSLKSLKQRDVMLGQWRVRFCIIGESHQVQLWKKEALVWGEMLACVNIMPTQYPHHYHFDTMQDHHYQTAHYTVSVEFTDSARVPPQAAGRLRYEFPMAYDVLPVTEVRWGLAGTQLHWWTLHTYPSQTGITYVYSQSTFKLD